MHESAVRQDSLEYCQVEGGVRVPYMVYKEEGTPGRRPLVLLHGISMRPHEWGDEFPGMIDAPVVAVGLPEPEQTPLLLPMHFYSRVVRKAIRQVVGDSYDVLGVSWGGLLAQQVAVDAPRSVNKLVLAATIPATPFSGMGKFNFKVLSIIGSTKRSPEDLAMLYGGDIRDSAVAAKFARIIGDEREIDQAHHTMQQLAAATAFGPLVMRHMSPLERFVHPATMVMAGDDDPIVPYYYSVVAGAAAMGARLERMPQGGHLFLFTRPEESAAIVNDFLK